MEKDKVAEIRGTISTVDLGKRTMLVKDDYITYPLKWTAELDVVCQKQKPGWHVVVRFVKEEAGGGVIKEIKFDEEYQKKRERSERAEQKLILLQSCFRTGSTIYGVTNIGSEESFDVAMDKIRARAILDAEFLLAEAKK